MHFRPKHLMSTAAIAAAIFAGNLHVHAVTTNVADYRADFHAGPVVGQTASFADGWSYLWNAPSGWNGTTTPVGNGNTGPITSVADFELLKWTGNRWSPDGDNTNTNGQPGNFLTLNGTGGHPGRGSTQAEGTIANNLDRYAIAAYTVSQSGRYYLTNAFYQNTDLAVVAGGQDVRVSVNGNPAVFTMLLPDNATRPMNTFVGNLNAGDTIYVAMGPNAGDGSDGFAHDFTVSLNQGLQTVVADYRDDFQTGGPKAGWQYLWNAPDAWTGTGTPVGGGTTGPIGNPANYIALNPVTTTYRPDLDSTGSNGAPGNFLNFGALGGHPGSGSTQPVAVGNNLDRYAIAAFTVDRAGEYAIIDSFINSIDTVGNGGLLFIHINNNAPIYFRDFGATALNISFDLLLGQLVAGDTIYVGVGPNTIDGNDSFNWDFSIARIEAIPEPATAMLGLLGALGLVGRRRRLA